MPTSRALLIVGGGLAGAKAAEAARLSGHDGRIVLVTEEASAPYERPPLSKAVLRGEAAPESALVHDEAFYREHDIDLITGARLTHLDLERRRAEGVGLDGTAGIDFDSVVLATGAQPRRLNLPGATLDGVHYLRSIDDAMALRDVIKGARRVAVIGAGWIGCEVAASARQIGADVVLIEPAPAPLHRVLGTTVGSVFVQLHADHGVSLRLGVGVTQLRGQQTVSHVVLADGSIEAADVVVAGIGVVPRLDLAVGSGLDIGTGVLVDQHLQAAVPGVYAAGDIAESWHPRYRKHLRVEHWANALHQGAAAGRNAIGHAEAYTRLPYFFSDQYDLGLEYVGYAAPDDDVVIRGDLQGRKFVAFYHRDQVVSSALAVNVWDVVDDLKAIVGSEQPMDLRRLADPAIALPELAGTVQ
jgi:3-phenylpropionate/trans-cinnamate dioxygenase ferredoxin reductase subunit